MIEYGEHDARTLFWNDIREEPSPRRRCEMWRDWIRQDPKLRAFPGYQGWALWATSQHVGLDGSGPHMFLEPRRATRRLTRFPKEPWPNDSYNNYDESDMMGMAPYAYQEQRLSSYGMCGSVPPRGPNYPSWWVPGDYHAKHDGDGICPRCGNEVDDD